MQWLKRIGIGILGLFVLAFVALFIMSGGASGKAFNEVTVTIDRPAEEVFPWLVKPEKLRGWIRGYVDSVPLNGDSLRVGARTKEIINADGERFDMEMELTGLEMNRLLAFNMTNEMFDQKGQYQLTEANGSTTVHFTAHSQFKGFFMSLVEPMFTPVAQKQYEENIAKLKEIVEAN